MQSINFNSNQVSVGYRHNHAKYADLTQYGDRGVITGLRVYWHDAIVGLEFAFAGQSSGAVKGSYNQQTVFEDKVDLLSGDFVTRIFGRAANDTITCFGIRTFKGYSRVWGDPTRGDAFVLERPGQYVKSLTVGVTDHVCYLEPHFEDILFLCDVGLQFSNYGKFSIVLVK